MESEREQIARVLFVAWATREWGNGTCEAEVLGTWEASKHLALRADGLELAGKIAAKTGCKVQGAGGTARIERGAGRVPVLRLHFVIENAQAQLKGTKQMVLCGAKAPYAFFAYPGKPSVLSPEDCEITTLCPVGALNEKPTGVAQPSRPDRPTGKFTLEGLGQALGATMPEGAIVVDESVTTGRGFFPYSAGAPRWAGASHHVQKLTRTKTQSAPSAAARRGTAATT